MMLDDASGCNMVLVDFSEYIHSAEGLQDANVITIIDHHGDGSVTTGNQIIYDARPLGSTATIIWIRYRNYGIEPDQNAKHANISVTAICETADVHRSTFYKYYTDPVALLMEIEQDFLDRIPTPPKELNQQNQEQCLKVTTAYFDDVKENKKAYRILLGESTGNRFATRLVEYLCSGNIPVGGETDELTSCFVRLYIANGTVGMLREWVEKDCPVSSRKISEMMYFLSQKIAY